MNLRKAGLKNNEHVVMKQKKNKKNISGLHILGNCKVKDKQKLNSINKARQYLSRLIKEFDLHELGSCYHKFTKQSGFTCIINLAESHIALHTWPEFNYLTLDVYICNYTQDNSDKCKIIFQKIIDYFKPIKMTKRILKR